MQTGKAFNQAELVFLVSDATNTQEVLCFFFFSGRLSRSFSWKDRIRDGFNVSFKGLNPPSSDGKRL